MTRSHCWGPPPGGGPRLRAEDAELGQDWRSDVPEGRAGAWAVERFEVRRSPPPRERLAGLAGPFYPPPAAGSYTRLRRGQTVFMTDTPDEWLSHRRAVAEAGRRGGRVLVNGLGLGLVVEAMLRVAAGRVERLTVVELAPEVIELVAGHLAARYGERLEVVEADALAWTPPAGLRYSVVWHDIWPEPNDPRCWPEVEALERRWAGRCDWQASWPREYLAGGEAAIG